jgi:AcrR family transcriptional regulator
MSPSQSGRSDQGNISQRRQPVRANGHLRYEHLLDAAEQLLQSGSAQPLAIQRLAREAGVPTASVYHFFPNPAAVSIALAERYLAGLETCLCAPVSRASQLPWFGILAVLNRRALLFYRQHPYAQALILGSDHSLAIRRADLANNRRIAEHIASVLQDAVADVPGALLFETVVTGITVGDAVFAQSIIEQGEITDGVAHDAWLAACAYFAARIGLTPPASFDYSTFIE